MVSQPVNQTWKETYTVHFLKVFAKYYAPRYTTGEILNWHWVRLIY